MRNEKGSIDFVFVRNRTQNKLMPVYSTFVFTLVSNVKSVAVNIFQFQCDIRLFYS